MTIPSDAAKKANTCLTKCCSFSVSLAQSLRSCARSISSAVQNEASAFLYISQMRGYWIGKMTKRLGFSLSRGSLASSVCGSPGIFEGGWGRVGGDWGGVARRTFSKLATQNLARRVTDGGHKPRVSQRHTYGRRRIANGFPRSSLGRQAFFPRSGHLKSTPGTCFVFNWSRIEYTPPRFIAQCGLVHLPGLVRSLHSWRFNEFATTQLATFSAFLAFFWSLLASCTWPPLACPPSSGSQTPPACACSSSPQGAGRDPSATGLRRHAPAW